MNIELSEKERIQVINSKSLYTVLQAILNRQDEIDQDREHFWVIGLNNANWILFIELVSLGTVKETHADPMEVFSFALQKRAVHVILAHNHPSGKLSPSPEDLDLTDRLIQVGIIVKTPVLDHLIITPKNYYSFADDGQIAKLSLSTKWEPNYVTMEKIRAKAEKIGRELGRKEGEEIGLEKGEKIGEKRGREEGEKCGLEKGAKKRSLEIATEMKRSGIDPTTIQKVTGLSKDAINKLS